MVRLQDIPGALVIHEGLPQVQWDLVEAVLDEPDRDAQRTDIARQWSFHSSSTRFVRSTDFDPKGGSGRGAVGVGECGLAVFRVMSKTENQSMLDHRVLQSSSLL